MDEQKGTADEDVRITSTNDRLNKSFVLHGPKMKRTADEDVATTKKDTSKAILVADEQNHIRSKGTSKLDKTFVFRPPKIKGTANNDEVLKKGASNEVLSESLLKLLGVHEGGSGADVLIASLEEKMKKMEELYKKSMDEQQDMRYKYDSAVQDLATQKLIGTKLIEENKKLQKKPIIAQNTLNEQDKLELEVKKWKQRYEDLLRESSEHTKFEQDGRRMDDLMDNFKRLEQLMFQQNAKFSTYFHGRDCNTSNPVIEISSASTDLEEPEEQKPPPVGNVDEDKRELVVLGVGIIEPTLTTSDFLEEPDSLNQTFFINPEDDSPCSEASTPEEEISQNNLFEPVIKSTPAIHAPLVKSMSPPFLSVKSTFIMPAAKKTKSKQPSTSPKPKQPTGEKQITGTIQPVGTKLSTETKQPTETEEPALPSMASMSPEKVPQGIEYEPENKLHKLDPTSNKAADDTIHGLNQIIDGQKQEIADLKQKLEKKYDHLQTTIAYDREYVNQDVKLLEQYEKSIDAINDKYTAAMEELDNVMEGNKVLKQKIEDLENMLREKKDRPSSMERETTKKNTNQSNHLHTLLEDIGNVPMTEESQNEPLRDSTKEQDDAKLLDLLRNDNENLERQLKEKDLHISNQKKIIDELKQKLMEPADDIKPTKNTQQDTCICIDEDAYSKHKQPKDQNMQDLANTNKKLQDQVAFSVRQEKKLLNELNSILSRSELEKDKLIAERAHIMKQLQSEKNEFKVAQEGMLKDLESVRMENEKLKQELRNMNAKLRATDNDVDKQLLKYKGDNADLQDKLKMSNAELKCLRENSKQNANLKAENSKLRSKVTQLDKRLSDLTRAEQTVDELKITNEDLKNKVKALEEKLKSLSKEKLAILTFLDKAMVHSDPSSKPLTPINEEIVDINPSLPPTKIPLKTANDNKEPITVAAEVKLLYDNSKYSDESGISSKDSKDSSYHEQLRISYSPKRRVDEAMIVTIQKKNSRPSRVDTCTKPANTSQRNLCNTAKQMPLLCYKKPLGSKPSLTSKQQKCPKTPPKPYTKYSHGHRTK